MTFAHLSIRRAMRIATLSRHLNAERAWATIARDYGDDTAHHADYHQALGNRHHHAERVETHRLLLLEYDFAVPNHLLWEW